MKYSYIYLFVLITSLTNSSIIHAQTAPNQNDKTQFEYEKKLSIKVFHPLLSVPSKNELGSKLVSVRNMIAKIPVESTPHSSKEPLNKNSCYPSIFTALAAEQKSGIRGTQNNVHYLKGIVYEICGQLRMAKNEYEASLKLRRSNSDALFRYAVTNLKIDRTSKVQALLDETLWGGFSQKYLVYYLMGLNQLAQSKTDIALASFEKSLVSKDNFAPAALESYHILKEKKKTVTSIVDQSTIDTKLYANLAVINRLNVSNKTMAVEYMQYLLHSGDALSSPRKLSQGNELAEQWLEKLEENDDDILLIKIQFLEKLGKKDEALDLILKREAEGELSGALQAKKTYYLGIANL